MSWRKKIYFMLRVLKAVLHTNMDFCYICDLSGRLFETRDLCSVICFSIQLFVSQTLQSFIAKTLPRFSSCDLGLLPDALGAADRTASFGGSITANFYFLSWSRVSWNLWCDFKRNCFSRYTTPLVSPKYAKVLQCFYILKLFSTYSEHVFGLGREREIF